jgi:catechol 2,3-dioxygenase-like lactoylglutathione lyase family enzyme
MTAIGGFRPASRRGQRPAIHSIGTFALTVPDLARAQDFYAAFGLDVREQGEGLTLATAADHYRWGRVVPGARKAMHHVTFHCFAEDFEPFKRHIEAEGVRLLDPPPGFESNGLWLRDQDGMLIEIAVGAKTSPDEKRAVEWAETPAGRRNAPYRRMTGAVRPRRLAHILRFTPDVSAAIGFYARVLGLRLSDRSGDLIAFMHGVHGSDHHLMAFCKSNAPGLHHLSWDVPTLGEVGIGAMAMAERGYDRGWGLGRHVLGSNYFHYVRDPWGSYCEYSCDIDFIPADMDWESVDHPAEDSFYLWGPQVPPEFIVNMEAGAA